MYMCVSPHMCLITMARWYHSIEHLQTGRNVAWRSVLSSGPLTCLPCFLEIEGLWLLLPPSDRDATSIYTSWRITQNQLVRLCNLAAFVVLIYLLASVNDFIIKNSKALLKAKLGSVAIQKHYQQGKSLKASANKETSGDVWKDIKCDINSLSADYCGLSWDLSKSALLVDLRSFSTGSQFIYFFSDASQAR